MAPTTKVMTETLRVSEIFLSLQGEGPSAGTPAHFVRLQGCGAVSYTHLTLPTILRV